MSGYEMKVHTYPPSQPPPYPGPPPSYGPTVVQPAPAPGFYPGTTTVVHAGTTVIQPAAIVVANQMNPNPTAYICPSCNQQIVTRVDRKASTRTHLFAVLLCVVGCWPCICLPYCIGSCNNADHYCPNCNDFIGSYKSCP